MAEVVKSIQASGGDYGSIASFISDLDNDTPFDAGDDVIGELASEAFSEAISWTTEGETLGLNSVTLRPQTGAKHDGTPGSGARVVSATNHSFSVDLTQPCRIDDIEFDLNNGNQDLALNFFGGSDFIMARCIVHNLDGTATGGTPRRAIRYDGGSTTLQLHNCLIFDINGIGTGGALGINGTTGSLEVTNCTFDDIACTNVTAGDAHGIDAQDGAEVTLRNNFTSNMSSTAGTAAGYAQDAPLSQVTQTNGSDDTSSPDGGSYRSITPTYTNQAGRDYSLSSEMSQTGTDLGADGDDAIDIVDRNRDTQGDTWSLGSFQFVAAASAQQLLPVFRMSRFG